ncbi:MAG: hypothetical protein K6G78_03655 [bacterium]|nr:hypothetical protein [bacterium]
MKDEIIGTWRCYAQKPKPKDDEIVAVPLGQAPDLVFEKDGTARQVMKKRFSTEEKTFRWRKRDDGSYAFFNLKGDQLVIFLRGDIHKNGTLTTRVDDPTSRRAGIITFYKKANKFNQSQSSSGSAQADQGKKKKRGWRR